jgi:hypothetical protein
MLTQACEKCSMAAKVSMKACMQQIFITLFIEKLA